MFARRIQDDDPNPLIIIRAREACVELVEQGRILRIALIGRLSVRTATRSRFSYRTRLMAYSER